MRGRAISEYVAQVTLAMMAQQFNAAHAVFQIFFLVNGTLINGVKKTRPSTTALELGGTVEQWLSAPSAYIDAIFVMVPKFARERSLGAALSQDAIFFRGQCIAPVDCIRGC